MKTCTFCGEQIQDAAIKCRYCREMLDKPSVLEQVGQVEKNTAQQNVQDKERTGSFRHYKWQFLYVISAYLILTQLGKGLGNDFELASGTLLIGSMLLWAFLVSFKKHFQTEKWRRPLFFLGFAVLVIGNFSINAFFEPPSKTTAAYLIGMLFLSPIIAITAVKTYLGSRIDTKEDWSRTTKYAAKIGAFMLILCIILAVTGLKMASMRT